MTVWPRKAVRGARSALAAIALVAILAGPAAAKPPLWIVTSPTAKIILFGSIHLLPPGLDWRPVALDDALAKADELWTELPINAASDNEASAVALARGVLPAGRSLTGMLTADEAEKLRKAAVDLHCAPDALDRMQPWMAEFTLSIADDARGGADAFNGVEEQVQAITPLAARRMAFESARQQIEFLAGAPVKDQIASLDWTLAEIEDDPASYQRVVDEWMTADLAGLRRDAVQPLETVSPALYGRLITQRNQAWARALSRRLRKKGTVVVVVGVGHMIGPEGLPALLRARGFKVQGPS
ncbi:MAG TPA: TraB/GumN family protein [Caulobacteraceae bacterium]|nr:TraB/GumN family protein [Caulobacteraceae bacterium]